jgi:transcriptional regulator with XRE-family HTH domain
MPQTSRRAALSQFLKSCRARLEPADAGLPEPQRRRTPGLRREDVAALSGVSVTWYTWLEQGRDVRVSTAVLERVASTLQMSSDEREYLFELAHDRPPPLPSGDVDEVTPSMQRLLDSLRIPAYILTMRWDVLAWNAMCRTLLRDFGVLPEDQRNLLKILFRSERDPEEYEAMAHRLVARLRVDYSQFPGDAGLDKLVTEMRDEFPVFRNLWGTSEVAARSEGISVTRHSKFGTITFEHTSYMPEGRPTLRLLMFAPHDEASAKKVEKVAETIFS